MVCPKCKYVVADYFRTCPECQADLSDLVDYFGPFYPPDPEFWASLLEEPDLPEAPEELPEEPEGVPGEPFLLADEEVLAAAELPEDLELEELSPEELEEEILLGEEEGAFFEAAVEEPEEISQELPDSEELPEIELSAEDLEDSLVEEMASLPEEEKLDFLEELEIEDLLPEEEKD